MIDAFPLYSQVPERVDWIALEYGKCRADNAVREDDEANAPQSDVERSVKGLFGEDAPVEEEYCDLDC